MPTGRGYDNPDAQTYSYLLPSPVLEAAYSPIKVGLVALIQSNGRTVTSINDQL